MSDPTVLGALLADYAAALDAHLVAVREEFSHVERAWVGLSDVYEGEAAEQFRSVFLGTAERMRAYDTDAAALLRLLHERLAALRQFDAPG